MWVSQLSSVDGAASLLHAMVTLGAVAITDIPGFADARRQALTGVPTACMGEAHAEAHNIMPDGRYAIDFRCLPLNGSGLSIPAGKTHRWTVATSTQNSIPAALAHSARCNGAAAPLRALISMASDHVFQGGYLSALRDLMHAYSNFSAVFPSFLRCSLQHSTSRLTVRPQARRLVLPSNLS